MATWGSQDVPNVLSEAADAASLTIKLSALLTDKSLSLSTGVVWGIVRQDGGKCMQKCWTRRLATAAIVVCGVLATCADGSQAQLVLYDNFAATQIDPTKWRGNEGFFAGDNPNAEAQRHIASGKLRVVLTTHGGTLTNTSTQTGRNGLKFPHPNPITTIQTTVHVKSATVQDCPANSSSSVARAQISGFFFNDGSSLNGDDATGDVRAEFHKQQTSTGAKEFVAFVLRCNDFDCFSSTTVATETFNTTWEVGETDTMQLTWEPAKDRFRFKVIPSTGPTEEKILSYTGLADDSPPQDSDVKRIGIANNAENCSTGPVEVSMEAHFDNVKLNTDAVP
jgi:hypothetical protein